MEEKKTYVVVTTSTDYDGLYSVIHLITDDLDKAQLKLAEERNILIDSFDDEDLEMTITNTKNLFELEVDNDTKYQIAIREYNN